MCFQHICVHRDPHVLEIKLSASTWRLRGEAKGPCAGY